AIGAGPPLTWGRWPHPPGRWRIGRRGRSASYILIALDAGRGVRQGRHETSDQAVLHFRRQARGDLLFGQAQRQIGGIAAEIQGGRFGGRGDLFGDVRLNLGHFGGGFAADALRVGFGFLLCATAQRLDFGLKIGETAIHFRHFRVRSGAFCLGLDHAFADFQRPLGEIGAGVLLDQVTQTAGQQQEVEPSPKDTGAVLCLARRFGGFLCLTFVLLGAGGEFHEQQQNQRSESETLHATTPRLRMASAIWLASASLSAARSVLACAISAASCALASRTAASACSRAACTWAACSSCKRRCNCSCVWYTSARAARMAASYSAVLAAARSRLSAARRRAPSVAS